MQRNTTHQLQIFFISPFFGWRVLSCGHNLLIKAMEKSRFDRMLKTAFGWLPARVAVGALTLLGFVNLYMVRVNISVAIVAMVDYNDTDDAMSEAQCLGEDTSFVQMSSNNGSKMANSTGMKGVQQTQEQQDANADEEDIFGEGRTLFDWDPMTQGLILASFSYGYAFTQVVGGRLAEVKGTKWVFGLCILIGGIVSFLTPLMAHIHYAALITIRIVLGLVQGVSWPSVHALVARWIPPLERPRFVSIVYFAATFSITLTFPLCGVVIADHGWEAVFYVCGGCSLMWCFFWFACMHDDPAKHPRISQEERDYIKQSVSEAGKSEGTPESVPWRQISTSLPMWAIVVCDMGNTFGLSIYINQLPTYMSNVLDFSIEQNGFLSGLPFLCRYLGAITSGFLADWLLIRGHLSLVATRKLFCSIAMLCPAALLIAVIYSGCSATIIIALLCLANYANGCIAASQQVNHTDIAPNFAGTLFGISNTFSSVVSSIAPVAVGAVLNDEQTMEQWEKVFWMCVPVFVVAGLFFLVFGSGSVQPWNFAESPENNEASMAEFSEFHPLNEEDRSKRAVIVKTELTGRIH